MWPCPMRLPGWHVGHMAVYVWQQDMEPEFPLVVLEYTVHGNVDPMHWHDHFEIALVMEGRGEFMFGRRALPAEPGDIFFIDNSQPHVALAEAGSSLRLLLVLFRPELVAGPGCRELDLGYLAPFRADERTASPRIRARHRWRRRSRPCSAGSSQPGSDGTRWTATSWMQRCAWCWGW